MLELGIIIGNRYEIIEKIGSGGMSDVYKAKCHKLNRYVAIKVLKKEFCENKSFVSKFRVEAQSAAGLSHPNIVSVYDVGEEGGLHYIVMELVEGITLKEYIQKKARLSVKESISIAIQVASGIEAAHNKHIIHRDIKPQNIIISMEGKVKVTDFGIARAATSNTITSNVMGSVHYTSPEQARGGYSDEKSDIYSLGITLFEMLTGRVPFNGDTTVAIAIKHIQEEMPSPRDFVAEIPVSVEQIIFKCTEKSPDRRYTNVSTVIEDLKKSLMYPDDNFVQKVVVDEEGKTRQVTDEELLSIKSQTRRPERFAEEQEREREKQREEKYYRGEPKTKKEVKGSLHAPEEEEDDVDPRMDKIITILGIVLAVIVAFAAIFFVGKTFGVFGGSGNEVEATETPEPTTSELPTEEPEEDDDKESEDEKVTMISLEDMTYEEAKEALNELGIGIRQSGTETSSTVEKGKIISQSVKAGDEIDMHTTVDVVISSGVETFDMIDVVKKEEDDAKTALEELGLVVKLEEAYDDSIAKGKVISTTPEAKEQVSEGMEVTVVISKGPKTVKVPDLRGLTKKKAKTALTDVGLALGIVKEDYSSKVSKGLVISQSFTEGTELEPGRTVDIVISLGEKPEENTTVNNGDDGDSGTTQAQTYKGTVTLEKPDGFLQNNVMIVLTQTVNGTSQTTEQNLGVLTESDFPYSVELTGASGVTEGIVTVYVEGVPLSNQYAVTFAPSN